MHPFNSRGFTNWRVHPVSGGGGDVRYSSGRARARTRRVYKRSYVDETQLYMHTRVTNYLYKVRSVCSTRRTPAA